MRKIRDIGGFLSICLFILSFSIAFILFFTPLYKWSIGHLGIVEQTGVAKDALIQNYRILVSYLTNPFVKTLSLPDFSSSADGLFHFFEVKRLFLLNNSILLVSAFSSFFFIKQLKKEDRIWVLIKPFYLLLFLPIVALFFIYVNFDTLFVLFHKVAFNNDKWLFNASTDPIIMALPQEFFMYCFAIVFVMIESFAAGGYFLSKKKGFSYSQIKDTHTD